MDPSAPKDNSNPTVSRVDKERTSARREPLAWSQMGSFVLCSTSALDDMGLDSQSSTVSRMGAGFGDSDWEWVPTAAEDRSILHALADISRGTKGKGLPLLRNAGLVIPTNAHDILKKPPLLTLPGARAGVVAAPNEAPSADASAHGVARVADQTGDGSSAAQDTPSHTPSIKRDRLDREEVFDIIRNIQDPEHPHTLEQLSVVNLEHVEVYDALDVSNAMEVDGAPARVNEPSKVEVRFTPTIPHCSMATLIGLCLRVKLLRSLPSRFKIVVQIQPGTHASENAINKQLRDKERVCAALENKHLAGVVNKCIKGGMYSE
uniref:MIP18 family-like domain-containing protein n=1 Tax=Craspedostauros australis TaxID=1486917 RepID=A0A7R9ZSG2_9STRA|mmetsp:Transcript_8185/g.22216  ORF Transcript_8185/g.22216 Transcript_8185/m.22216 type:complete len:320 (+) Transcript_8185:164-1123(+)|eukprot:CAMPEP_0198117240 /NCGR_PEP_ID=MMETSP1442-20131203/17357_1 /TAXON_ID= /ORGANISM="Craspedostauros australis, Strain CCMP3328" /LENGTH=319 /DNA_ID=CAMNT_0043775251 /DNA_START=121 /DNA_END=1080 /DNA_ORIENTATION=-